MESYFKCDCGVVQSNVSYNNIFSSFDFGLENAEIIFLLITVITNVDLAQPLFSLMTVFSN